MCIALFISFGLCGEYIDLKPMNNTIEVWYDSSSGTANKASTYINIDWKDFSADASFRTTRGELSQTQISGASALGLRLTVLPNYVRDSVGTIDTITVTAKNGSVLLGECTVVLKYSGRKTVDVTHFFEYDNNIDTAVQAPDGTIWVSTYDYLYTIKNDSLKRVELDDVYSNRGSFGIFHVTQNSDLWLSFYSDSLDGVIRISNGEVTYFPQITFIDKVIEDPISGTWVHHRFKLLHIDRRDSVTVYNEVSDFGITSADSTCWVRTYSYGSSTRFYRMNTITGDKTTLTYSGGPLSGKDVGSFVCTENEVYVSYDGNGYSYYDGKFWTSYDKETFQIKRFGKTPGGLVYGTLEPGTNTYLFLEGKKLDTRLDIASDSYNHTTIVEKNGLVWFINERNIAAVKLDSPDKIHTRFQVPSQYADQDYDDVAYALLPNGDAYFKPGVFSTHESKGLYFCEGSSETWEQIWTSPASDNLNYIIAFPDSGVWMSTSTTENYGSIWATDFLSDGAVKQVLFDNDGDIYAIYNHWQNRYGITRLCRNDKANTAIEQPDVKSVTKQISMNYFGGTLRMNNLSGRSADFSLITPSGRVVYQKSTTVSNGTVSLLIPQTFAKGIYIARIVTEKRNIVTKLLLK